MAKGKREENDEKSDVTKNDIIFGNRKIIQHNESIDKYQTVLNAFLNKDLNTIEMLINSHGVETKLPVYDLGNKLHVGKINDDLILEHSSKDVLMINLLKTTMLHLAILTENTDILNLVLKKGANINTSIDIIGNVWCADIDITKKNFNFASFNDTDDMSITKLIFDRENIEQKIEMFSMLISNGYEIVYTDTDESVSESVLALFECIISNEQWKLLEEMLNQPKTIEFLERERHYEEGEHIVNDINFSAPAYVIKAMIAKGLVIYDDIIHNLHNTSLYYYSKQYNPLETACVAQQLVEKDGYKIINENLQNSLKLIFDEDSQSNERINFLKECFNVMISRKVNETIADNLNALLTTDNSNKLKSLEMKNLLDIVINNIEQNANLIPIKEHVLATFANYEDQMFSLQHIAAIKVAAMICEGKKSLEEVKQILPNTLITKISEILLLHKDSSDNSTDSSRLILGGNIDIDGID